MINENKTIYLKDYKEPDFFVKETNLEFDLYDNETIVTSILKIEHNTNSSDLDLTLYGKNLKLIEMRINDSLLNEYIHEFQDEILIIKNVPNSFTLKTITQIDPKNNTSLEGLYQSSGIFCTQCEAEGFRRITWYPDRPDVMSSFTTKIIADKEKFSILLSNGNLIDSGESENNRHFATWFDPFKKPSYLFALVAGDLHSVDDEFTTISGRIVTLKIYVEKENLKKCDHAMKSLKASMKWDEDVFGREYDLDIYMIVAVDAFNMGAMENKGLNIFNSSLVLANPETATDLSFQRIEAVIAHEYFHNWSGNRVTCRDWFQLSLKEGFTVLRDQLFSADMGSETVKRIEDVIDLRTSQFAQDNSPMAHSVQPSSYIEISNFYTVTIYEKGAEVVRMIKTILGKELFRNGCDLYFNKFDGKAATIEDFVNSMEVVSDFDFSQFRLWYSQAGTPELKITESFDSQNNEYSLDIEQFCPDTPNQKNKKPFFIPFSFALLNAEGVEVDFDLKDGSGDLSKGLLFVKEKKEKFIFSNITEKPVLSALHDFSAPIKIQFDYSKSDYLFLMQNDKNGFSRWNVFNQYTIDIINKLITDYGNGIKLVLDYGLVSAFKSILGDHSLDKSYISKIIQLPSEAYISEQMDIVYVEAVYEVREFIKKSLAVELFDNFLDLYNINNCDVKYEISHAEISRRMLKNTVLSYLASTDKESILKLIVKQINNSNNMTDVSSALVLLSNTSFKKESEIELSKFYDKWADESLVVNQWLAIQARIKKKNTLDNVKKLLNHDSFDIKNPNKVRSLIGVFVNDNSINFHRMDGEGYGFLEQQVLILDKLNPQISARIVQPFTKWKRFETDRSLLMKKSLENIKNQKDISKDLFEIVSKSLA